MWAGGGSFEERAIDWDADEAEGAEEAEGVEEAEEAEGGEGRGLQTDEKQSWEEEDEALFLELIAFNWAAFINPGWNDDW